MYGLILEGIGDAFRKKFGDDIWEKVRTKAGVPHHTFVMHKTYSETVIPRLAKAGAEITGRPLDELMELCGYSFVAYVSQYGYDRVMRVLGRHLRDFLSGLDNLHEYLRFSYPKLKPPSFFCENESRHGLTLHYRSKRKGFVYYVMGQITQVANIFYQTPLEIELVSEEETLDMTHVVLKLHFDNTAFKDPEDGNDGDDADSLQVSSETFFGVFPFHIVFNRTMIIKSIGTGLNAIMSHIKEQAVDEMFSLNRPLVEFTMENVIMHSNNVFEIISIDCVKKHATGTHGTATANETMEGDDDDIDNKARRLKLKGQMMYMEEWDAAMFLGTPVMENLDRMFETGLYINDLSMHDSSRDLVLAGTQQQAELKMALDQEHQKSRKLEESMRQLEAESKKTHCLVYNMLPKALADKLRKGENAASVCQNQDAMSMLVLDIANASSLITKMQPNLLIGFLNTMFDAFEQLCDKYKVYRMDSIGESFVVVANYPVATKNHAGYLCDYALAVIEECVNHQDPLGGKGTSVNVKIGIHTGPAVLGIVGTRLPKLALLGETLNIAIKARQECLAQKVHITDAVKSEISAHPFEVEDAKTIDAKGGGTVKTFWLKGRTGENAKQPLVSVLNEKTDMDGMMSGFVGDDGDEPDLSQLYTPISLQGR